MRERKNMQVVDSAVFALLSAEDRVAHLFDVVTALKTTVLELKQGIQAPKKRQSPFRKETSVLNEDLNGRISGPKVSPAA
mmetsp:Transcript_18898/g.26314  ORF Transcript_18898/g.26314 Transcript_18898/m.26314 type:complete len:80 (+) Transcript_18898:23-262(+)|eukprot:CAMPEP_0184481426 /NCGR_PEP_ID=MMETSP0113_2-20130426/2974_1 /TAXON_ID=91329 /ORGANISM="Norrisiella sphaerica, Strain BC52" /LENGTH=79 /DNA_ID=CAMNT_0026860545 /DNA_START=23 /DNA_END=262 /DNA_ORIENTATION=-